MLKKITTSAVICMAALLIPAAAHADCSESYGGRLAASSPSAWAEWCSKCGGTVIRTSGSPYCKPGDNWRKQGGGATIGDGPYSFTATGDLRVDAPLGFLAGFLNELDRESKTRAARQKAEREEAEYLARVEAEQRAAEEARQRELSYERLSGVIKGVENSGELRLKGMGGPERLKLKSTPIFNQPGNPSGETTADINLKMKFGDPVQVSTVKGVPVDGTRQQVVKTPLQQKYAKLEEELKADEERLAKMRKAKEEAERLKAVAEENIKSAKERLKAPRDGSPLEIKTGLPENGATIPEAKSDESKLAEAEKLLKDALDFKEKVEEEAEKAEKDIKSKRQSLNDMKKQIEAEEKNEREKPKGEQGSGGKG